AEAPAEGKPRAPADAPKPRPAGAPSDAARPQPPEPAAPVRPRPPAPAAGEAAPKPQDSAPVPTPAPQPGARPAEQSQPGVPANPPVPQAAPGTPEAPASAPVPLPPNQAGQPGAPADGEARQRPPVAPPVTPEEIERARRIAENPAASDQTVVLPVENGAAVLDSAKEAPAPLPPGDPQRPDRRGPGERPRPVGAPDAPPPPPPKSDAEAQAVTPGRPSAPVRIEPVTAERGERLREAPRYDTPRGFGERRAAEDGRIIFEIDNRTFVRHDDSERFYEQGYEPRYERLRGGRVREVIERDGGTQIVTIRDRYGNILQRSRIDRNGREYVLYYAPDLPEDRPGNDGWYDPGRDLPPMRLTVPVDQYIIDTSTEPDRDYYRFLEQPPVERVERVYSLDEVRYSARIRDKVRRIDLDTITFGTGSADIPMSQAKTLRRVADAIQEILQRDPSETFLIEGHTDAVGSDESNLVLSDRRAESVANLLTDVYGIPPENLATQGYGERYLKVLTDGPSQENRRVTIRRITPLVKPVAQSR
ncbi:OmpA family protein, partial [Rhizobium sp. CSW-27]|uniref:OmpA family protein n=1 Tax=Rhizobium sp. CSW-27 TaxID=2839985 RepID=UPI001C013DD7